VGSEAIDAPESIHNNLGIASKIALLRQYYFGAIPFFFLYKIVAIVGRI